MTTVSTLGLQLVGTSNLQSEQQTLALLNQQLATGQKFDNLTKYTPTEAKQLMDLQNGITQRQSYIDGMKTVSTRLSVYDLTMTDMEKIAAQASSLSSQNQTLDPTKQAGIAASTQTYLQQVINDLNQKVGDRYVYAGSRYSTQPVIDLTSMLALGPPTLPFSATVNPALPTYDSEYATSTTDATAFNKDSVQLDSGSSISYGVTSVSDGFQQFFAGLQLMYAASQTSNATTYQTDMTNATQLISSALNNIQTLHAGVAAATNTVSQEQKTQQTDIDNLQSQIGDIQKVDLTEIGTNINLLQTQLQASYSATANLSQLSILKYL